MYSIHFIDRYGFTWFAAAEPQGGVTSRFEDAWLVNSRAFATRIRRKLRARFEVEPFIVEDYGLSTERRVAPIAEPGWDPQEATPTTGW
jgi:hypothetical protein